VGIAGVYLKFGYAGPAAGWVADRAAGALYVLFWVVAAALVFPRAGAGRIAFTVLAVTCLLETLQLWQPRWLGGVRASLPGRALLGHHFDPRDFAYYVVGSLLGARLVTLLRGARSSSA
jgi:hypothetical protein